MAHTKTMTNETMVQSIKNRIFADPDSKVYAVLDGAAVPDLLSVLYLYQPECECLYRGELEPDMAEVAPYLVRLDAGNEFTNWVFRQGWGKHWGIFAVSRDDFRALRSHFRRFLMVFDCDGKPLYFRYYDPRVLRVYLPTCTEKELETVFGPVNSYFFEDEDPKSALWFQISSGGLQREKLLLIKG